MDQTHLQIPADLVAHELTPSPTRLFCTLHRADWQPAYVYEEVHTTCTLASLRLAHPTGGQSPVIFSVSKREIEVEWEEPLVMPAARAVEYFSDPQVDHDEL